MTREPEPIKGRCLCAAVEFQLHPPTDFLSHCHCQSCRLAHAAAFVTWTSVPEAQFEIVRGESSLRWYQSSEWIRWGFCGTCGSSMFYRASKSGHHEGPSPKRIYVAAGALLDAPDRVPQAHVSFEEKLPWLQVSDSLPKTRGKTGELLESEETVS